MFQFSNTLTRAVSYPAINQDNDPTIDNQHLYPNQAAFIIHLTCLKLILQMDCQAGHRCFAGRRPGSG